MKRIRFGLVGLGYWGRNYFRVLKELPSSELAACCDVDGRKLAEYNSKPYGVKMTTSPDEVLLSEEVDAVVISTPASTHYAIAKRALEHGKHVLVEKPTATSYQEAEELHKIAERNGLRLMTGLVYRYHPAVTKLKALLQSGTLGDVRYIHCERLGLGPIREDVNVVLDLAPHDISIVLHLLEKLPQEVMGFGLAFVHPPLVDVGYAVLSFGDGIAATVHVGWLEPLKTRRVTLVCERKMAVFDDVSSLERLMIFDRGIEMEETTPESYGEFRLKLRRGDMTSPALPGDEPLRLQCEEFLTAVKAGAVDSEQSEFELRVMRVLEAVNEAVNGNKRTVLKDSD